MRGLSVPIFAVYLKADEVSPYLEPDGSLICDSQNLTERGEGAPDFIIEIVSSSGPKMDYSKKNALYSDASGREYKIVVPAKECTAIYLCEEDASPIISLFAQTIKSGVYSDLHIISSGLLS